MKMQKLFLTTVSTAIIAAASVALAADTPKIPAGTYNIDPAHSKVGFEVSHLVISTVEGKFNEFTGKIIVGAQPQAATSDVEITTGSVDTGNVKRDEHLKSPDFFDAKKFPKIVFKSGKIEFNGSNIRVPGELTIKGVSKPVVLEGKLGGVIKDMAGDDRMAAQLGTTIERKDFGLTWNKMVEAGPVIGEKVTISVKFEAVRKK